MELKESIIFRAEQIECALNGYFSREDKDFSELLEALADNWEGHEELLTLIQKKGKFFGNDDALSNAVARRFTDSLYRYLKDKRSVFGHKYLVGNLIGYIQPPAVSTSLTKPV